MEMRSTSSSIHLCHRAIVPICAASMVYILYTSSSATFRNTYICISDIISPLYNATIQVLIFTAPLRKQKMHLCVSVCYFPTRA